MSKPIAVSFGSASFWGWFTNGYVAFTDRRMLFLEVGSFLREGVVDREVLWADVAELVCERGKNWEGGPDLQVRGERDFRVAFTSATALTRCVTWPRRCRLTRWVGVAGRRSNRLLGRRVGLRCWLRRARDRDGVRCCW